MADPRDPDILRDAEGFPFPDESARDRDATRDAARRARGIARGEPVVPSELGEVPTGAAAGEGGASPMDAVAADAGAGAGCTGFSGLPPTSVTLRGRVETVGKSSFSLSFSVRGSLTSAYPRTSSLSPGGMTRFPSGIERGFLMERFKEPSASANLLS